MFIILYYTVDKLKNTITKITNEKYNIEQKINQVINTLEEKIELIQIQKKKFFECLEMKINMINLIINNYEKKLKEFDINYFIISNLESIINFNLLKLDFDNNDSLDKKIDTINLYLKENIKSNFISNKKDKIETEEIPENFVKTNTINFGYEEVKKFRYDFIGFLDFNSYLFAFYSSNALYFISKHNYEIRFQTDKYEFDNIKTCKKINDEKILVYTNKNIITLKTIENSDYIIEQKIEFSEDIYDFNQNLDLLFLNYDYKSRSFFFASIRGFSIELISFPHYNRKKYLSYIEKTDLYDDKIQWYDNDSFFHFSSKNLEYFIVKNNSCYLEKSTKININLENVSIFDLNKDFFCLKNGNKIVLLNKSNLVPAKTINTNSDIIAILKLSDKFASTFISYENKLEYINYDILSNGIKWNVNKTKNLLHENVEKVCIDKNHILCIKRYYYD